MPCINLATSNIEYKKDKIFARAIPCIEENKSCEAVMNVEEKSAVPLPLDKVVVGSINEEDKQKLFKLLNNYRDCFALSISELGCSKSAEMKIKLHEEKPFSYRPYRMSRMEQSTVKDMVDELLLNGIIRKSEYSSPLVIVRKKNGEARLDVDYRKLNSLSAKENQPLPRIDDQIDKLQAGNYFISLDLRSGCHQVPLEEESKPYTASVTPEGQY